MQNPILASSVAAFLAVVTQSAGATIFLSGHQADFQPAIVAVSAEMGKETAVAVGGSLRPDMHIAVAPDGAIVAADGATVVRVNPATGSQTVLASGLDHLQNFQNLAVLPDNDVILFGSFNFFEARVVRVSAATGESRIIAAGGNLQPFMEVGAGKDGSLFAGSETTVLRIDPVTGNQSVVVSGIGLLDDFQSLCVLATGDVMLFGSSGIFEARAVQLAIPSGQSRTLSAGGHLRPAMRMASGRDGSLFAGDESGVVRIGVQTGSQTVVNGKLAMLANVVSLAVATTDGSPALPQITTHPQSCVVGVGSRVTLSARATPETGLNFQWRLNGQAIPGATGDTLAITAVGSASVGNYTLVASNSTGSAESTPATVTLFELGSFTVAGFANTVITGPIGATYQIEFREALGPENDWQSATTLTLASSPAVWIDEDSLMDSRRFYRAVLVNP